jgi:hypothetical protein
MQKLFDLMLKLKLKKECLIKEQLNKLYKKVWKNEQNESKLRSDEDLMELKLLERKLLKKVIYQHKLLELTLIIQLLELRQFMVHYD